MARESFSDPDTAAVMNREFVNIKVDREERPDLDRVYQLAFQALNGRGGGWPLTVFLTPDDLVPFFAGTYFPPRPLQGMPAFEELLEQVARAWREQRDAIHRQNAELQRLFDGLGSQASVLSQAPVEQAVPALESAFDAEHGGFGDAPKFPHPGALRMALERGAGAGGEAVRARHIAEHTLESMARGGLLDQLGGGFARYSTDARWQIPHFEKMLCDNGLLLALYADAATAHERPDFAATARATADWMLREMGLPEGGFGASLDADSEGEEGRFYVWSAEAVEAALAGLDASDAALARRHYGFDRPANFEGRWHPVAAVPPRALAEEHGLDEEQVQERLERARLALLAARDERERPHRDDKVLTAWNALAVHGLAVAGRRLGEPRYVDAALACIDFLRENLLVEGRLHAVWRGGTVRQPAFLDDHAGVLTALLDALQACWRDADLALARQMADTLIDRFQDTATGGFFQTADDHEALPYRPKPLVDEAIPSANGLAAQALDRLGHLLGEPRYLEAARGTLAAAMTDVERDPLAHATLVRALAEQFEPPQTVVLRGEPACVEALTRRAAVAYRAGRLVFAPGSQAHAESAGLPQAPASGVVARCCRGPTCDPLRTDVEAIARLLAE
jgi:hypothetical protein